MNEFSQALHSIGARSQMMMMELSVTVAISGDLLKWEFYLYSTLQNSEFIKNAVVIAEENGMYHAKFDLEET